MKHKYDFVFSLGSACLCSQSLRNAGLQYASYPLDWVWGGDMRMRTDLVTGGFEGWFEKEDFQACPDPEAFGHDPYVNRRTGMLFPHAFPKSVPIDGCYKTVRGRMDRQISRFYTRMDKSRRVLIVWFGDSRDKKRVSRDDIEYCMQGFSGRWPGVTFEMLVLDRALGVPPEAKQSLMGPGFRLVAFDYRDYSSDAPEWAYCQDLVMPFLARISARDYRTGDEKRRYRRYKMEKDFKKYGVSTPLACWLAKVKIKIMRHLRMVDRGPL